MKYIRTKDGITTNDKATHELIEDICDAGYFKTLEKGAYVRIDEEWANLYGHWVDIIDENGCPYSIRPNEVKRVTKELPHADTIEELCDEFIVEYGDKTHDLMQKLKWAEMEEYNASLVGNGGTIYGAIWTDKGLIYVAKMNDKGELELL